jgi:hypothetical protein
MSAAITGVRTATTEEALTEASPVLAEDEGVAAWPEEGVVVDPSAVVVLEAEVVDVGGVVPDTS